MDYYSALATFFKKSSEVVSSYQSLSRVQFETRLKAAKQKKRLKELYKQLMLALDLIKAYMNGSYLNISRKNLVIIVAACLYFLSPFDAICDFLLFGLSDDFAVLTLVFSLLKNELDRFYEFKNSQSSQSKGDL
ncbi:MAG: DUF1232 domain-containing protein [Proteobacteria bacterium]|nr:DUF1232 domain-containing protein [Pseudomonadota bacterium]